MRTLAAKVTIAEIAAVKKFVGNDKPEYCGLAKCGRNHLASNLCRAHYLQLHRSQPKQPRIKPSVDDVLSAMKPKVSSQLTIKQRKCFVDGCRYEFHARGLCRKHYSRWYHLAKGKTSELPTRASHR